MSPRPGRPTIVLSLLALALAAAACLASMPWLRAYQVGHAPLLLVLASVLPVAMSAVTSRSLRSGALVAYGTSATGLVVLLVLSNRFDLRSVWGGLVHVPAQLLSETLPLSGATSLLAAPMVLSWLCGAACGEMTMRSARPGAAVFAVPVATFCLAFAATTSGPPGATLAEATALLGVLVIAALARQGVIDRHVAHVAAERPGAPGPASAKMDAPGAAATRRGALRRSLVGGALALALTGGLGLTVSSLPAFASRPDALTRPTSLLSRTVVDPIDALTSLRDSGTGRPPVALFSVATDGPWSGYLAVATLDRYDGNTWSFSATFHPTGGRVPLAQPVTEAGTTLVTQSYVILHPIGEPFLPALDRPVQVGGLSVDVDAATGMLAAPTLPGTAYTVRSQAPLMIGAGLAAGSAIAPKDQVPGGETSAETALPQGSDTDVAAAVRFAASLTGRPASGSFAFIQALSASLSAQDRRAVPPPAGHAGVATTLAGTSLAQVINAVTVDRAATPEQFATFLAVVARYLGVPARVVTGFRAPAAASSGGPLPPGRYRLTDRDAWTWAEVPVVGYGWVVVDPTPLLTTADISAPPEQVKATPPAKPRQATALPGQGLAHAIAKPVKVKVPVALHVDWALLAGIGIPALLIVLPLVGIFGGPWLRRRWRRRARHQPHDPALLATGAWLELIDGLSRLGLEVDSSATSTEVVSLVAGRFGDDFAPPARTVAQAADRALYCQAWPPDQAQAQSAWDSQEYLCHSLRRGVDRRQRARSLWLVGTAPSRPAEKKTGAAR